MGERQTEDLVVACSNQAWGIPSPPVQEDSYDSLFLSAATQRNFLTADSPGCRPLTGIPDMLVLGFIIGLTGALAPGPTLVAAIDASVKGGWSAGPKVTLGHIAVEILMVVVIAAGLSVILTGYSAFVAAAGGIALVMFGLLTLNGARSARIDTPSRYDGNATPVLAGFLTSIGNPYFWIWWLTVGSAFLISAMEGGLVVMLAFIAGHWSADLVWYTLVSAGIHKGRFFLGQREYRLVLAGCGIFLVGFGIYYLSSLLP